MRGKDEQKTYRKCNEIATLLHEKFSKTYIDLLGPAPMPFYKIRGQFRWHVLLKLNPGACDMTEIFEAIRSIRKSASLYVGIDVDPAQTL